MSLNPNLYTILSEASEPTQVTAQYVWGARPGHRDELILRDRDTGGGGGLDERLYCLMDYFDPTAVIAPSGSVVERYGWSAFGQRLLMDADWEPLASSAAAFDFGFHGQFLDSETGYYNYGYRYYSPEIGRWLSRDLIGEKGGENLYALFGNSAVNGTDYLGLEPVNTNHPPNGSGDDTEWHFTSHSIELTCQCACANAKDSIYYYLSNFTYFNSPNENIASVQLNTLWSEEAQQFDTTAKFDINGFSGFMSDLSSLIPVIGNSLTIDVNLTFNREEGTVTAETLGRHVLVGIRRWEVKCENIHGEPIKKRLKIGTRAWERFRTIVGRMGGVQARQAMDQMWSTYINNLAEKASEEFECEKGDLMKDEGAAQGAHNPYLNLVNNGNGSGAP